MSLALRLLLCVCLIANGAGVAQASARMAVGQGRALPATMPMAVVSAEEAPCHAHARAAMADMSHAGETNVVEHRSATGKHSPGTGHSDCCKGKGCDCACAPQASCDTPQATMLHAVALIAPHPASVHILFAQPRLPHLIRPPIG